MRSPPVSVKHGSHSRDGAARARERGSLMLCPNCHRQLPRGAAFCTFCGTSLNGSSGLFDIVLPDRTRIPLASDLTLGRASTNSVQFTDASVSRRHAQIAVATGNGSPPVLTDSGSSFGTWLDGSEVHGARPLHDGSRIRLGNQELLVERRRSDAEPARTIVVPAGASVVLTAPRSPAALETAATRFGIQPRLRSGYALKRLAASEGPDRWILKRLDDERFVQLSDANAELLELLDGTHSLQDLVAQAERRFGDAGAAQLVGLLGELSEGGFLEGSDAAGDGVEEPAAAPRLFAPREKAWPGAGRFFERLYERGGWLLFTRPALLGAAALAVLGAVAFVVLVVGR